MDLERGSGTGSNLLWSGRGVSRGRSEVAAGCVFGYISIAQDGSVIQNNETHQGGAVDG